MAGGRSMGQITPGVVLSKVAVYAVGLLFMAFGVAFSVNSGLGVSPVNSLPYVVSLVLGVDMGSCVIAVFCCYVLVQIVIYRRDFKWVNLTQILFSTLFGYFVDFAKAVVGDFALPTYPGQLIMLAVSMTGEYAYGRHDKRHRGADCKEAVSRCKGGGGLSGSCCSDTAVLCGLGRP